ncbi:MAG: hypothetical protein HYT37_00500 [Candidatus Sungbacteria bacterium]|nr:hypothetical protein [Candidatus Sungbacteria bacterium]
MPWKKFLYIFLTITFVYTVFFVFLMLYFDSPFDLYPVWPENQNNFFIFWAYGFVILLIFLPVSIIVATTKQWLKVTLGILEILILLIVILNGTVIAGQYSSNGPKTEISDYFFPLHPNRSIYDEQCGSYDPAEIVLRTGKCQCSAFYFYPNPDRRPLYENPTVFNFCKDLFIRERGESEYKNIVFKYSLFNIFVRSLLPPMIH